ncbi:GAF domain-containing protein [Roseicyclus marinus]|uniref:GAF domain-containing protein n=1 Tax=Roseicyclus marinus TaxID=2161673 RepID=A0AA48KKT6_9RHOB|nr:hypothetical protein MACH21_16170 [Roseicyclus marinus]
MSTSFPLSPDEASRISVLKEMSILDTIEERKFDDITALTSMIFDVPSVTISLVDETRQWFKSHHGLNVCETDRGIAFCNYTVMSDQILEITDPLSDARFRDNPLVTGDFHLRYYCGAPIIIKGQTIGALCLLDYSERSALSETQRKILTGLAKIAADAILNRHLLQKSTMLLTGLLNPDRA